MSTASSEETQPRGNKREEVGVVTSDKMDKITVELSDMKAMMTKLLDLQIDATSA